MKNRLLLLVSFLSITSLGLAQPTQSSSSAILLKMKKLNVLGSALYLAAHPDDENTRLIGYLSNEALVNTAYLALTRGDGGQNLVGPELREGLGLIRTQELLAARRVDGSSQFFTRANDFGYSKTAKETLQIWDKDKVLQDVVWTIRKFRPDVIITRFPPDQRAGHGHHTSSAILAEEAFDVASTNQYGEQLKSVKPWQPTRLMINSGRWWDSDIESQEGVVKVDAGAFNPYLGESYTETAARSRSMHKSQGFGSMGSRGESREYLSVVKGDKTSSSIFDGIDITWNRVGQPDITKDINTLINNYSAEKPYESVKALFAIRDKIKQVGDEYWRNQKLQEVESLIFECSGMFAAAWAGDYTVVPGRELAYSFEMVNRSPINWQLKSYSIENKKSEQASLLAYNQKVVLRDTIRIDKSKKISGPYWLEEKATLGMYTVNDLSKIGTPENAPPFVVKATFLVEGNEITRKIPMVYHWRDRVIGEMVRPVTVTPPGFLNLSSSVYIFNNSSSKSIEVDVIAGQDNLSGTLNLDLPEGWSAIPNKMDVTLAKKGESQTFKFNVTPSGSKSGKISASLLVDGEKFQRSIQRIEYDHIPYQLMLPGATARAEDLEINNQAQTVGYIMGAGDAIPESLEQIGVKVWIMGESDITEQNLKQLDAVIFGIRAANTLDWLSAKKPVLMEYIENGGTMIMQYNTTRGIDWNDFAPYELKFTGRSSDSRVAEETAAVSVLMPDHPVMNFPNKITEKDFDGWVQERGLYFPTEWDSHYSAVLSSHDTDEDPKAGGLLIADYGRGYFVYTGYSWFRELPAGVPGAYRLFSNILSLGKQIKPEPVSVEKSKKKRANRQ